MGATGFRDHRFVLGFLFLLRNRAGGELADGGR